VAEQALFVFVVAGVRLALRAQEIDVISAVDEPTPLPGAPAHLLGLVTEGERVLPLVDLALLLDLDPTPGDADPLFRRTLFVRSGALEAGLVCHRARGLISLDSSGLCEPMVLQGKHLRPFLSAEVAAGQGVIGVLDLAALLRAASVP
jgi:purine-binding chemotaxis protein CheW